MVRNSKSFVLTILAMFAVGALCLWQPSEPGGPFVLRWPSELVTRFGEALIIASVLAVTVELYTKKRMLREVVQDVFQYIAGHPLPDQLKDRIKKLVRTDLIRKDLKIRYDFAYNGDRVLVTVEAEFRLENLSSSEIPYQQRFEMEVGDAPRVLRMRCVSSERNASYDLDEGDIEMGPDPSDVRQFFAEGRKIKIRPNLSNPAISYVVMSKYQCSFPVDYSDVFSFILPTVGTTVMEVGAAPEDLEVLVSDFRAKPVAEKRWEFSEAFTRSECFRIRWYRRPGGNRI